MVVCDQTRILTSKKSVWEEHPALADAGVRAPDTGRWVGRTSEAHGLAGAERPEVRSRLGGRKGRC